MTEGPRRRSGQWASLAVVVALLASLATSAQAARFRTDLEWEAEQLLVTLHNQARADAGVAALLEYRDVREVARAWTDHQAARGRLEHNPDYSAQICCETRSAENVAMRSLPGEPTSAMVRSAITAMHNAYMNSSTHRRNILHASYRHVGIGMALVKSSGTWFVWSTTNFRTPDGTDDGTQLPAARDIEDTCGPSSRSSFTDVPALSVHGATIACIEKFGITKGRGDGTYGPKDFLSRGQIATFMTRTLVAAGHKAPSGSACPDGVHAEGMSAMHAWGIFATADGCDELQRVTRWQMATWSVRALQKVAGLTPPSVKADWFHDDNHRDGATQGADNAIAAWGVVTGVGNDRFLPDDLLRRDQMATFLARVLDTAR